jgi:hypothetical protein
MTPMLILLFGVTPSAAISSDLVAAVVMRPIGAGGAPARRDGQPRLVGWMVIGSVPAAFLGAYLLHLMGNSKTAQHNIEVALGAALLVGAAAMVLRYALDRRSGQERTGAVVHELVPRPLPTCDRGRRRDHRRHDVGRLGVADDRAAAVPVPDDQRQPARRHRPHAGGAADAGRRARRAGLRPRRVRRHRSR